MAKNKEYDEIMQEITAGLTGDKKKDYEYLNSKMEEYKGHKYNQEILRACGRLISSLLPEEAMKRMGEELFKHDLGIEQVLEEVRFNQYKKNFSKAIELIEPLVNRLKQMDLFKDDAVSEYHCFGNLFEEILYKFYNKPEKDVRQAGFPLAHVYTQYGSSLIDVERWDDARAALREALRWNPASAEIMFEYSETFKVAGEMDEYLKLVLESFRYCYVPATLARAYRNLGWYFIEKELYDEAIIAYVLSLQHEKNDKAQGELFYIAEKSGKELSKPTVDEITACSEKYDFL